MGSNLLELTSEDELKNLIDQSKGSIIILNFWATWVQPCSQMNEVFTELASKNASLNFVDAEKFPELSESFEIAAVPTFIFLKKGKIAERVDGANAPELTNRVAKYSKVSSFATGAKDETQKIDLNTRLKTLVNSHPVVAFIKGTPSQPRLKEYSKWPTYPQVYIKGEFVGGLDIIKELVANDEFKGMFQGSSGVSDM
ncbi:1203_t:CDS:2 [Funneliformis geosporum]|uniref:17021_t:CDS:1 n=1 Tax=Funneliformis geosporum TaxID=1117311 RepID=A0A9W4SJV2_9GLOM|nr:1203_t:CDS:2 [Funneliformis geosporum]CAI2172578.1 17021_t:CDS:2 [Funneliformis geosporum]